MPTVRDQETAAVIALLRRRFAPATKLAELIETRGSALALLRGSSAGDDERLFADPAATGGAADPEADLDAIAAEIDAWRADGIAVLSVFDDAYPLNLRTVHDRPPVLYVRGALTADDTSAIAVVGTRRASEDGCRRATKLASQLAEAGHVIASGLAAGIDTAAHQGALEAGGRTIAVIGTGLNHSYPRENADLQRRLGETSAVISQFPPDQPGARWTFPQRNAVMSGLSLATVLVEAGDGSGARIQAERALEHGRPVFFLRNMLEHDWARAYAGRPSVYVADTTDDVVRRIERMYTTQLVVAS
jgi:DNA processing protein